MSNFRKFIFNNINDFVLYIIILFILLYNQNSFSKSYNFYKNILAGAWALDCNLNPKLYSGGSPPRSIGYSIYKINNGLLYEDQYYDPPVDGINYPIKFLKTGEKYVKIKQGNHIYEYIFSDDYDSYRIYSDFDISQNTLNVSVGKYVYVNAETPYVYRCRNLDM